MPPARITHAQRRGGCLTARRWPCACARSAVQRSGLLRGKRRSRSERRHASVLRALPSSARLGCAPSDGCRFGQRAFLRSACQRLGCLLGRQHRWPIRQRRVVGPAGLQANDLGPIGAKGLPAPRRERLRFRSRGQDEPTLPGAHVAIVALTCKNRPLWQDLHDAKPRCTWSFVTFGPAPGAARRAPTGNPSESHPEAFHCDDDSGAWPARKLVNTIPCPRVDYPDSSFRCVK